MGNQAPNKILFVRASAAAGGGGTNEKKRERRHRNHQLKLVANKRATPCLGFGFWQTPATNLAQYRADFPTCCRRPGKHGNDRFADETLWPEFQQINSELGRYLNAITDRVIQAAIFADDSDAETRAAPAALPEGPFTLEG